MDKERNMEKLFNRRLDAMLAHETMASDISLDGDTLSALEFAARMRALCVKPAPEFQSKLKARLLQKLAEEEEAKASQRGWLSSLFRQPAVRLASAMLFVAVVGAGLWAGGVFGPQETTAPVSLSPVTVSASTSKLNYEQGETVFINVSISNMTPDNLQIEQYPPIVSLMDSDTHQAVYTFRAGSTANNLLPNDTASFTLSWDQLDARGEQVSGGSYYIELEDLYYQGNAVKMTLAEPVSFNISTKTEN
jgi:hypothetical protein